MTLELMLAIERWLTLVEAGLRTAAGHAAPRQAHHLLPWAVSAASVRRRVQLRVRRAAAITRLARFAPNIYAPLHQRGTFWSA